MQRDAYVAHQGQNELAKPASEGPSACACWAIDGLRTKVSYLPPTTSVAGLPMLMAYDQDSNAALEISIYDCPGWSEKVIAEFLLEAELWLPALELPRSNLIPVRLPFDPLLAPKLPRLQGLN